MVARFLSTLSLWLLVAPGCAKPPPAFEEVPPADQLYAEGLETLEGRRILGLYRYVSYTAAIETFQAIIDNFPYSDYAVLAEIKIADAYFDDGKYEEALSYYRDFGDLHPQNEKVPYTIFRAALCHRRRVKSPNRDQTATRDALVFLDQLLSRYPHSEYAERAEVMWRNLRMRLAFQIRSIGDFYLGRDEYQAAAERYRSLLNEYPGLGLDAETLYKLAVCYQNLDRGDEAALIFQSIVQYYGNSSVAEDAQKRMARAADWTPQTP
ncbi:MAG: outer membrane protein assembly factor BamD [Myxococcales bacterium]|nr:outer membrane protein assembly factor BamD [Myxococcales bacterium]